MAGIFNVIGKLFGNKYEKDIKKIKPIIDLIHEEHTKISSLNNDELREQTQILVIGGLGMVVPSQGGIGSYHLDCLRNTFFSMVVNCKSVSFIS